MANTLNDAISEVKNNACRSEQEIIYSEILLPIGGILSVISYLYLFYMYFVLKSPVLKRHPTKCLFVQQYIWLPFVDKSFFYSSDAESGACIASVPAGVLSCISQFGLLGGELWFFIISMDLRLAYTNPFSSYKQNRKIYLLLVFIPATVTSLVLAYLGPTVYGLASESAVWIQDASTTIGTIQGPVVKFALFYAWMIFVYFYCIFAVYFLSQRIRQGFADTLKVRLAILKRTQVYVIGYSVFWSILLSLELASSRISSEEPPQIIITSLVAYLFAFRGIWSLVVILYTNRSEISLTNMMPFTFKQRLQREIVENAVAEGLSLKPHLNTALRAEILFFTTQGIIFAAKNCDKHYGKRTANSSMEGEQADATGKPSNESAAHSPSLSSNVDDADFHASKLFSYSDIRASQMGAFETEGSVIDDLESGERPSGVSRYFNGPRGSAVTTSTIAGSRSSLHGSANDRDTIARFAELQRRAIEITRIDEAVNEAEKLGLLYSLDAEEVQSPIITITKENPIVPMVSLTKNHLAARSSRFSDVDISQHTKVVASNDQNERPSNQSATSHRSSADTIKWRDTMDIEFSATAFVDRHSSEKVLHARSDSDDLHIAVEPSFWQRMLNPFYSRKPPPVNSRENPSTRTRNVAETSRQPMSRDSSTESSNSLQSHLSKKLLTAMTQLRENAEKAFLNHKYDEFKFKDFLPVIFRRLRDLANIDTKEYADAFLTTTKETFSEGRSGAFMFFSSDQKYICKGTTRKEIQALRRILPKYVNYVESNPNTLITRFLGAHCITMYDQEIFFLVMLNVFPTTPMSERYDLKGSWINRHRIIANDKKLFGSARIFKDLDGSSPLFFDNDIQQKISLVPSVANAMANQIRKDIVFLREMDLMDYSLLIGIKRQRFEVLQHESDVETETERDRSGGSSPLPRTLSMMDTGPSISGDNPFDRNPDGGIRAAVVEGAGTYYFGIIDILQEWTLKKKMERFVKTVLYGHDGNGLSAIAPDYYAARFYDRCVVEIFEGLENSANYFMPKIRLFRSNLLSQSTVSRQLNNSEVTSVMVPKRRTLKEDASSFVSPSSISIAAVSANANQMNTVLPSRVDKSVHGDPSDDVSAGSSLRGTVRLISPPSM